MSDKIAIAKKICYNLKSDEKRTRKQALLDFQMFLKDTEFGTEELHDIFNETHLHLINSLRDKSEPVREQSVKFFHFYYIDKLPINDYYLTYLFPLFVERIGTVELVEESEEVRLQLLQLLRAIITKYSNTVQLKPFLNDIVTILCETVKDKYPAIKEASCMCVSELSTALPRDFHMQAEQLVEPVLSCFNHQRYKIRVEAIKCMGDIIMHSTYKAIEEAVTPLAERLFDQIPAVRRTVTQIAARLSLEYRDRYSFFHKLLPLILTSLNDEVPETRNEAHQLWKVVGLQYQKENEKDLKEKMDYLLEPPKYYPENLERPNLGCRELVQRNVIKLAPALSNELSSWQADVRVRCSQLLCAIAQHAEDGVTQQLQGLLPAMYTAARDEDQRVVVNVVQAAEYFGLFVPVDTWKKLVLPAVEDGAHYGHLTVLSALIRGAPEEYVSPFLEEIAVVLADENICQSRKKLYQRALVKCVDAISEKCSGTCEATIGKHLFTILVTLISLRDVENQEINTSILDKLHKTLGLDSSTELWRKYSPDLLDGLRKDPRSWTVVTAQRCIFETFLLESGEAFGENLVAVADILSKTLDTEAVAESRLKTFVALSATLENKDVTFRKAENTAHFLETLITEVLVPTLVWHAGRTAEAMRTMAACCLRSALLPSDDVDIFCDGSTLRLVFDKLLPLLLSLMDDASYRSRQLAIEDIALLKDLAQKKTVWTLDDLIKIYPDLLKRLDDPMDKVRISALKALPSVLSKPPEDFTKVTFKPHHELILDTLLTHFDDDDSSFQALVMEVLKSVADINRNELVDKVKRHRPLLRNKDGCDKILEYLGVSC